MWQEVIRVSITCWLTCVPARAQNAFRDLSLAPPTPLEILEVDKTVFPITEIKLRGLGLVAEQGTGFCLDPECRFIATNYHVAMTTKSRKIRRQKVIHQYLATGPDDEGASMIQETAERVNPFIRVERNAVILAQWVA